MHTHLILTAHLCLNEIVFVSPYSYQEFAPYELILMGDFFSYWTSP